MTTPISCINKLRRAMLVGVDGMAGGLSCMACEKQVRSTSSEGGGGGGKHDERMHMRDE